MSVGILLQYIGGSKVDSGFHTSQVDQMSTRDLWEVSGKN